MTNVSDNLQSALFYPTAPQRQLHYVYKSKRAEPINSLLTIRSPRTMFEKSSAEINLLKIWKFSGVSKVYQGNNSQNSLVLLERFMEIRQRLGKNRVKWKIALSIRKKRDCSDDINKVFLFRRILL